MSKIASVEQQLVDIFANELNVEVTVEMDLIENGILDSMMFVDLIMLIEENFGFQIPADELEIEQFRSVKSVACMLVGEKAVVHTA